MASFTNQNQRVGHSYDLAGNLTSDGGQAFTYNAQGQAATASFGLTQMGYDGDGLRLKKVENGTTTYYLRSTVLGQQVACELSGNGVWQRGYVYLGGSVLAIQDKTNNRVRWTHQEPYAKSQRITDGNGEIVAGVELEPFGLETNRSFDYSAVSQKRQFTTYERDGNNSDEAMLRRYNRWGDRFDQPDPYEGSMSLADPQSLNRYAYVQNYPVNFVDPSGLLQGDWWAYGYGAGNGWSSVSFGFGGGGWDFNARPRGGLGTIYEAEYSYNYRVGERYGLSQRNNSFYLFYGSPGGFSPNELKGVNKALNEAKTIFGKSDCQQNLAKAGIDVNKVKNILNDLVAQPDTAANSTGYNVFNAETSSEPGVVNFLQTEQGKTSNAFVFTGGAEIYLRHSFFNARGGAKIAAQTSRALVLIHEAVHIAGYSDQHFGGSAALDDLVIRSCFSTLFGHDDLSIVGN